MQGVVSLGCELFDRVSLIEAGTQATTFISGKALFTIAIHTAMSCTNGLHRESNPRQRRITQLTSLNNVHATQQLHQDPPGGGSCAADRNEELVGATLVYSLGLRQVAIAVARRPKWQYQRQCNLTLTKKRPVWDLNPHLQAYRPRPSSRCSTS